jgi:hypothetical protein
LAASYSNHQREQHKASHILTTSHAHSHGVQDTPGSVMAALLQRNITKMKLKTDTERNFSFSYAVSLKKTDVSELRTAFIITLMRPLHRDHF